MKLANVIHHDHTLVPVINRFGIQLGFGNLSIEEICKKHHLDIEFFVTILNAFHDPQYFPTEQLQRFSVRILVEYLQKAHAYFMEDKLPEIAAMIEQMDGNCLDDQETCRLIRNFFDEYSNELHKHIDREEQGVYPYVLQLEQAYLKGELTKAIENQLRQYSIAAYQAEHEDVEEKLFDLKNIFIQYLPAPKNDKLCYQILRELFTLEKELNEHARIEDMILVPKVNAMEKALHAKGFGNE
jgi:regulator of cell morphogenesis and NO signaling